jgi:hypothetical protein
MPYCFLADMVTQFHLAFVLFAVFGAFLAIRWRRIIWLHIPAALWAALVEYRGWICPLTPLEDWLRIQGGEAGYAGGFVERYLLPILYPAGLAEETQMVLGSLVLALNLLAYCGVFLSIRRQANKQKER